MDRTVKPALRELAGKASTCRFASHFTVCWRLSEPVKLHAFLRVPVEAGLRLTVGTNLLVISLFGCTPEVVGCCSSKKNIARPVCCIADIVSLSFRLDPSRV